MDFGVLEARQVRQRQLVVVAVVTVWGWELLWVRLRRSSPAVGLEASWLKPPMQCSPRPQVLCYVGVIGSLNSPLRIPCIRKR